MELMKLVPRTDRALTFKQRKGTNLLCQKVCGVGWEMTHSKVLAMQA